MGERLTGSKVHSCLSGVGEQDEKILITNPESALSLKGWEGYTSYPGGSREDRPSEEKAKH